MAFGLGALLGGVAGGLLGKSAAKSAAGGQVEAARIAAESAKFDPYDVSLQGVGGAQFDEEGKQVDFNLDPRLAGIAGGQYGRAEDLLGRDVQASQTDPRLFALGGGALGAAGGFLQGAQAQQPSGFGLMGQGGLQAQDYFQQAGQQDFGAGQGFLNQLNQFDPEAATATRLGQLEKLLEPSRGRTREALEGRLLRQGRLGSTGGALSEEALETSIGQQQLQNLMSATGESRAQQQQLLGMGQGLGQEALGRAQGLTGLGAQQGGFLAGLGGQVQQAGQAQQAQQAGLFGQFTGLGADVQGLRSAEDYKQLQLEQAYQQAGLGAVQAGQGLYQSPLQLGAFGAELGGRQSQAGAYGGALTMQGAQSAAAAKLGGAAGLSSALGKIGSAFDTPMSSQPYNPSSGGGLLAAKTEDQWANNWEY